MQFWAHPTLVYQARPISLGLSHWKLCREKSRWYGRISEYHDTRWKFAVPNLADQSSSQLLTQTYRCTVCQQLGPKNQSSNKIAIVSCQKMEQQQQRQSCWLWKEVLCLKMNHPVMQATMLRQVCGPPFLPETPLQEAAENSMQWPRRPQFHDTQWLSTPDRELYPQFGIVELWVTN